MKKFLGVLISNFESYTRYSWVADQEQNKNVLGILSDSFLESLIGRGHGLLLLLKGAIWKKKEKPCFKLKFLYLIVFSY